MPDSATVEGKIGKNPVARLRLDFQRIIVKA